MIPDYEKFEFTYGGTTRPVYRRGIGPGVIVIHEIPGIHPTVIRFANWVVDAGMTVFMPELLGTTGKARSNAYIAHSFGLACIRREFSVLAANRSSPITEWLRALAKEAHDELGGPGVGAVGMCLTGNFALSMMMEPSVIAPVLSQPSLPLSLGSARKAALHISPEELANLKRRAADGCSVIGLRFTEDPMCPPERFETLRQELGSAFEAFEIDSATCPNAPPPGPHSVLTEDLVDEEGHPTREARDRVIQFFQERLLV